MYSTGGNAYIIMDIGIVGYFPPTTCTGHRQLIINNTFCIVKNLKCNPIWCSSSTKCN